MRSTRPRCPGPRCRHLDTMFAPATGLHERQEQIHQTQHSEQHSLRATNQFNRRHGTNYAIRRTSVVTQCQRLWTPCPFLALREYPCASSSVTMPCKHAIPFRMWVTTLTICTRSRPIQWVLRSARVALFLHAPSCFRTNIDVRRPYPTGETRRKSHPRCRFMSGSITTPGNLLRNGVTIRSRRSKWGNGEDDRLGDEIQGGSD